MSEHTTDDEDLEPCPFCGSTVVGIEMWNTVPYIRCNGCEGVFSFAMLDDMEELIRIWNTRGGERLMTDSEGGEE